MLLLFVVIVVGVPTAVVLFVVVVVVVVVAAAATAAIVVGVVVVVDDDDDASAAAAAIGRNFFGQLLLTVRMCIRIQYLCMCSFTKYKFALQLKLTIWIFNVNEGQPGYGLCYSGAIGLCICSLFLKNIGKPFKFNKSNQTLYKPISHKI